MILPTNSYKIILRILVKKKIPYICMYNIILILMVISVLILFINKEKFSQMKKVSKKNLFFRHYLSFHPLFSLLILLTHTHTLTHEHARTHILTAAANSPGQQGEAGPLFSSKTIRTPPPYPP